MIGLYYIANLTLAIWITIIVDCTFVTFWKGCISILAVGTFISFNIRSAGTSSNIITVFIYWTLNITITSLKMKNCFKGKCKLWNKLLWQNLYIVDNHNTWTVWEIIMGIITLVTFASNNIGSADTISTYIITTDRGRSIFITKTFWKYFVHIYTFDLKVVVTK